MQGRRGLLLEVHALARSGIVLSCWEHDGQLRLGCGDVGNGRCGVGDEENTERVGRSWVRREGTEEESATSVERDGTRLVCCVGLACGGCGCWGDRAH